MKVLAVDDSEQNRKLLKVMLEAERCEVITAADGEEALQVLDRTSVDAIISDILMPRMDGYRLCHEIRKSSKHNAIPIILFSATYTSLSDEKVALDFGADKFLKKPASPNDILDALREVMKKAVGRRGKKLQGPRELLAMREYSEALVRKLEESNLQYAEANKILEERTLLANFSAEIANVLTQKIALPETLQLCTEAMVHHLNAAFARIWTYNPKDQLLELQASAGMYPHLNGSHARVPVGQFKIGLIAAERKPHLTNCITGDDRLNDQEWAIGQGMVAFAGYPLIVEERLVGVMAMFAKTPVSQNALDAMASVAKEIAAGIERKKNEDELRQSGERFRELAENIREIFFITGPDGTPVHYVSPAFEAITGRSRKGFEANSKFWLDVIHPDDRGRVEQSHRAAPEKHSSEHRIIRLDGSIRWLRARSFPVHDDAGKTVRLVGIAEDITERMCAEQAAQRNLERIQALRQIDSAITSTLELEAVLNLLLEKLVLFLPHHAATVRLYNPDTHQLDVVASRNIDEEEWTRHLSNPKLTRTLSWTVFDSGKPLASRDISRDSRIPNSEFLAQHGLISFLGAPLIVKGEALGVLTLYGKEEHVFTEEEIDFLSTVAGRAAIAIYNAKLYEQTKRQAADLIEQERIQRILKELSQDITAMDVDTLLGKLTATIRDVFRVDISDVRFLAGNQWSNVTVASQNLVQRLPGDGEPPRGATEWVVKNRKSIAIDDYLNQNEFSPGRVTKRFGVRGFLAAPLLSKSGEIIGVIRALSKEPRTFTVREIDLFEQLANGAAIAIENERLYADLETSNKIKTEFLNVMSHELRTPLNIIMGYTALAKQDMPRKDDANNPLTKIEAQSKNLLDMINSIMEATEIESGAISVEKQLVDVGMMFRQLRVAYERQRQNDPGLIWRVPDDLPHLVTDYEKLRYIMKNLINNAIKFTNSGTVTISARLSDRNALSTKRKQSGAMPAVLGAHSFMAFKVSDTGIGIAEKNLPFIFDAFKQVDSSTTRGYGGIGLGLYAAKKYCGLLGGTIDARSKLGKGSTFTVRIPVESVLSILDQR